MYLHYATFFKSILTPQHFIQIAQIQTLTVRELKWCCLHSHLRYQDNCVWNGSTFYIVSLMGMFTKETETNIKTQKELRSVVLFQVRHTGTESCFWVLCMIPSRLPSSNTLPSTPHPHPYKDFIKVSVMKMPLTAEQWLLTKHRTWTSPSTLLPPPVWADRFPRARCPQNQQPILWLLQMF